MLSGSLDFCLSHLSHVLHCPTKTFMKDPADPCVQVVVERQVAGQGGELELLRCTLVTFQRQGKSKYI